MQFFFIRVYLTNYIYSNDTYSHTSENGVWLYFPYCIKIHNVLLQENVYKIQLLSFTYFMIGMIGNLYSNMLLWKDSDHWTINMKCITSSTAKDVLAITYVQTFWAVLNVTAQEWIPLSYTNEIGRLKYNKWYIKSFSMVFTYARLVGLTFLCTMIICDGLIYNFLRVFHVFLVLELLHFNKYGRILHSQLPIVG